MEPFAIGSRVRHKSTGEYATVVEPRHPVPDGCVAVRYDGEDNVWHTSKIKLEEIEDDPPGDSRQQ